MRERVIVSVVAVVVVLLLSALSVEVVQFYNEHRFLKKFRNFGVQLGARQCVKCGILPHFTWPKVQAGGIYCSSDKMSLAAEALGSGLLGMESAWEMNLVELNR